MDVIPKDRLQSSAVGSITLKGPLGKVKPEEVAKIPTWLSAATSVSLDDARVQDGADPPSLANMSQCCWYLDILKFHESPGGTQHSGYGYRRIMDIGPRNPAVRLFLAAADNEDPPQEFRRIGIGRCDWDAQDVILREVTIV